MIPRSTERFMQLPPAFFKKIPAILAFKIRLSLLIPFVIFHFSFPLNLEAQWINHETGDINIPVPDMAAYMRFGNTPVSYYTGMATASIPVYHYKDDEFEIPVSLEYAYEGYRPNVQAGPVGLGWYLNFGGGMITRQVYNIPDEDLSGFVRGYWEIYQSQSQYPEAVHNPGDPRAYDFFTYTLPNGRMVEGEPDIFSFDFLGHKGKFMLGPGKVFFFESNHPKSFYNVQFVNFGKLTNSQIIITTADGYEYVFGGDAKFNRLNLSQIYRNGYWVQPSDSPRTAWPLKSVKSPGGKTITYDYYDIDDIESINPTLCLEVETYAGPNFAPSRAFAAVTTANKQPTCLLKTISVSSGLSISFEYSNKRYAEKSRQHSGIVSPRDMAGRQKLDRIIIRGRDVGILRECELEYMHAPQSGNPIAFLYSVRIKNEGLYTMTYYDNNTAFPYHGTLGIDHWGFYNGRESYDIAHFYPASTTNDNNEEIITGTQRNPSFENSRKGMLRSLWYPTSGYTSFEYETHKYSRKLTRNYNNNQVPYVASCEEAVAGGVRVKELIDRTDDYTITRRFLYESSGTSTGLLIHEPRYKTKRVWRQHYIEHTGSGGFENRYLFPGIDDLGRPQDQNHIAYEKVTEVMDDDSRIEYKYYTHTTGASDFGVGRLSSLPTPGSTGIPDEEIRFFMSTNSMNSARGKLIEKSFYGSDGVLYQKEEYTYRLPTAAGYTVKTLPGGFYEKSIFVDNIFPGTTRTIQYILRENRDQR